MKFFLLLTLFMPFTGLSDPGLTLYNSKSNQFEPYQPILRLQFQDMEWTYDLSQTGFDGIDTTTIDRSILLHWLERVIAKEVNRPARSAYYHKQKLVPDQWGSKLNLDQIETLLQPERIFSQVPVQLPIIWKQPALTTAQLKQLKQKQLGTYTTRFNPSVYNRSHNIRLSSQALDHHVVMPGEIFSFNQTVGIRSLERGYRPAKVIVKGEYSEGIGGGICQTSSTLFNSVDQAGLKVLQRVSHSKHVPYVPENRDATVSWGGPDFRFQNQFREPILIVSRIHGGYLNISIYGPRTIQNHPNKVPPSPKTTPEHTQ